jgi:oxygen-independent coproporphyrinogen-3 oxidase
MAGLYIHIPFCKQACHYCDFYFSTNQSFREPLIRAIASELRLQIPYLSNEPIETIYFGGGTPSLLSQQELEILVETIHSCFTVTEDAEITLEANPDDLTKEKLYQLKQATINRLSIGIQSFQDSTLQYFNRAHNSEDALSALSLAREAGFTNISIDLIYAVPDQESNRWKKDLDQLMILAPEHVSAYSLTIEDKTAFGKWRKTGKINLIGEDEAIRDFEEMIDVLSDHGYEQYEISNFCKPGYQSRHNTGYWQQKKYLGLGPSAHSYNGDSRQSNVSNNHLYLKSINQQMVPFEIEVLNRDNKINEYIFTTLRTQWGCDLSYLDAHLNYQLNSTMAFQKLVAQKLIVLEGPKAILTQKGKLLADQIAIDLFV